MSEAPKPRLKLYHASPSRSSVTLWMLEELGEPFEIEHPMSVVALLDKLEIDARRVAVEHNLTIIKRQRFPEVIVNDGDSVEIVNFVGGG